MLINASDIETHIKTYFTYAFMVTKHFDNVINYRHWCKTNYGPDGLPDFPSNQVDFDLAAQWCCWPTNTYFGFFFKEEADLVLFKLIVD